MLREIALHLFFGRPLVFYAGLLTLGAILLTALVGRLILSGRTKLPLKFHLRLAYLALTLALLHALLALSLYF